MTINMRVNMLRFRYVMTLLAATGMLMAGCSRAVTEFRPVPAATDIKSLRPGLTVLYFDDFYKSIYDIPQGRWAARYGVPGPPIPFLNHRFGKGQVFDSGRKQGVGMQITGFIHFTVAGKYLFKAKSNDGIRIRIGEKVIIEDAYVHSDRFSAVATVHIDRPGWYSLKVLYFQRKGTATIELYWQIPGQKEFQIVPAAAYGHITSAR